MPRRKRIVGESVEEPKKVKRVRKLQAEKSEYEKVKSLLDHPTWITIVQPLLDKMIIDTVGGCGKDGMWSPGIVGQANGRGYSTDYLLGYRMGLIDFNNRLKEKQFLAKKVDEQIKDLKSSTVSMTSDVSTSWSYMPQPKGVKHA